MLDIGTAGDKADAKDRVKAKFRSRHMQRATLKSTAEKSTPLYAIRENIQSIQSMNGVEVSQRIDFYERSLQSISMNQSRQENDS